MIITTQDLKSYTICPMLCKFNTAPPVDPLLAALKKALSYLYAFEMSNNHKVTESSMINRWDRILASEAKDLPEKEMAELAVEGWLIIKRFMDRVYNTDKRTPHIVGLRHKANIGNIHLQTLFDVVLMGERGKITLLEFGTVREAYNVRWQLAIDIEAKAKLYLLKQSLGRISCELIRYNLNKPLHKVSLKATPEFMKETEETILGIINNIQAGLFYQSPTCKCPHPEKCKGE
jgi:hypothetical protein